jgi:hypothetical protein
MRVPLETYITEGGANVYSLVVAVPFTPIDIDVGLLARGKGMRWGTDFGFGSFPKRT